MVLDLDHNQTIIPGAVIFRLQYNGLAYGPCLPATPAAVYLIYTWGFEPAGCTWL